MLFVFSPYSDIPGKVLSKVTTMPVDISHGDKLESSSSKFRMERSKTERLRHLSPEDAAQIFDDKIPVQEKVYGCVFSPFTKYSIFSVYFGKFLSIVWIGDLVRKMKLGD